MSNARINFTAPTQREDNSTLPAAEIAAYRLERIPNAGGDWTVFGSDQPATSLPVVPVNSGDAHQYRVRTVDTSGRVSTTPSSPVEIRFDAIPPPVAAPKAPTGLSVTYL